MDEEKRKALESLPRPSPIGLSQSMWTTICPFDPEVKLGGDADDDLDDTPPIQMWRMAWLKAMTDGANAVLELDDRLRRYWTHVENSALFVRRSSRMADLVELVAQRRGAVS